MTQEDKELLLKDLSARLPYRVKCKDQYGDYINVNIYNAHIEHLVDQILSGVIQMALRPMLSMTEEEREEVEILIFGEWFAQNSGKVDREGWIEILANYDVSGIDPGFCSDYVDWLNAHHFDHRGLIDKGLAIEITEENNPYKE